MSVRLQYIAAILVTSLPLAALALDIPRASNRLQKASEIEREFVVPLRLEGQLGIDAIAVLLSHNFRCGLHTASESVLTGLPLARCHKSPSGFGELCDDLTVTLRFKRSLEDAVSKKELLHQINQLTVASASPFCPAPSYAPSQFIAARAEGQRNLERYVSSLDLPRNGRGAFEALISAGFACGLTSADASNHLKIMCNQKPSGLEYCFQSTVAIELKWLKRFETFAEAFRNLSQSEAVRTRVQCDIPKLRGGVDS